MNTIHSETELSLTEQNRRAAQAVLPHYERYGIHYLSDRHAILTWARRCWKSDYAMEDLPSTLRWAVGIDACATSAPSAVATSAAWTVDCLVSFRCPTTDHFLSGAPTVNARFVSSASPS